MTISTTSLAAALFDDFGSAVQRRGADYFRSGRVRIESSSAWRVSATVRGTARYLVTLERKRDVVRVDCSCPYFEEDLCKHIWAVILAADAAGALRGDGHEGKLRAVPMEAYFEDDSDRDESIEGDFDADDDEKRDELRSAYARFQVAPKRTVRASEARPSKPDWRKQLAVIDASVPPSFKEEPWPAKRELLYVIDAATKRESFGLGLEIWYREPKLDGTWSKPKLRQFPGRILEQLRNSDDRRILASLEGADELYAGSYSYDYTYYGSISCRYRLTGPEAELMLPLLCRTGRCRLRLQTRDEEPKWLTLKWDDGEPWQFRLEVRRDEAQEHYTLAGALTRGRERVDLSAPSLLLNAGILFLGEHVARYQHRGAFNWVKALREQQSISVPVREGEEFLDALLRQSAVPALDLPEELRYEELVVAPRPRLTIKPSPESWQPDRLRGALGFEYGDCVIPDDHRGEVVQKANRRIYLRDREREEAARERLLELGFRKLSGGYDANPGFDLAATRLPRVVRELMTDGWRVEAQGKLYRAPGRFNLEVSSGVDWFELHGAVEFGDTVAQLPKLLEAARRGEKLVKLDDGSFGLLPEEWLAKYGLLAGLGTVHSDHLRFSRAQVGLLDALLAAQPQANVDRVFERARDSLKQFQGIRPADPPPGFRGELRPYQREGLGWLNFLREFGFGGCLADDMGLGKTVQVLALLEERRAARERDSRIGPSLVVVPKSLVFNWKQEAERFAPQLRVLDHTGNTRRRGSEHFEDYDLLVTTYGTLRNDAVTFKDVRFDYVILDEAQAIKNEASISAKAARLLTADHRLALSGTPIENHLGELWSLFEFLNPGMLGAASVFKLAQKAGRDIDEHTRHLLAQALRPFILRRTKSQVLRDLPPKLEQTLYCELEPKQRKQYDELRDHYRQALLQRIERDGLARAKIQILEALLRLRQAAIHPGLIDKRRVDESSAKLELLLPQLQEAIEEGHKAVVFSQFTSMLAIIRTHLDRNGVNYEYLDGKTKNREARVERFQTDASCKLFLVSLKAGGTGLNLTAAQYVFLLDPWWNPAVEAQAIDRTHRIGQTSRVFAYRIIARDTIEEKVLTLQSAKRDLADAILGADKSMLRNLDREDLELLLS